jgi:ATP-binding cassette subfamily B protein
MMMIKLIFYAPMMGFGAIVYAATKAPKELMFLDIIAVSILIVMVVLLFIFALPRFKIVQKLIDKLNLIIRENLSGMTVIRAFNKQKKEAERFDKANRDLTKVNLFINRLMTLLMPAMTLLMSGLTIAIMWIGSDMIVDNRLQVGDLMAFIQYAMQIVMSFLMISVMFIMIPRASVGGKRISEVLETKPTIKDGGKASLNGKAKGVLAFENVGFRYEGAEADALTDVSFTAEPNKVFAIIGTTGSGKSTIVNLIPRFYDVSEGRITLDGVDIRDLPLNELRDNVAIVAQKSLLFSGTVMTNLALANSSTDGGAMYAALETAQIRDFVKNSKEGLDKSISQGGQNVSGGQKQRLSIARALVKDSPVLIFDDSFSALDFKTDAKLRRALKSNLYGKSIIIVAQRIGTIKDADEILVLDEGRTAGIGNHKYLMENCEAYREIAFSQLSKEELL